MKKCIILLVLTISAAYGYAADYQVIAEELNVRSCPSTKCDVISSLKQGEKVQGQVAETGWLKIKVNNSDGYVSTQFVKQIPASSAKPVSSVSNKSGGIGIFGIAIIVIIVLTILWILFGGKCPKCKKTHAMRVTSNCVGRENTHVTKKFETKNKGGEVVRTTERPVPATRFHYEDTHECRYCGFSYTKERTKVKEN